MERRRSSHPAKLLLAVDVGNTHITVGVFQADRLLRTWRLHTHRDATSDELGLMLTGLLRQTTRQTDEVKGVVLASVVPSLDGPLEQASRVYLHQVPVVVGAGAKLGIRNLYKRPDEVGADRLVNAVAVHHLLKKPAIVVDFGTATTFDCVTSRGDYLGGTICPGLELAAEALARRTAKLPHVIFDRAPKTAMGKTTQESLQSGLFWGYIAMIEGLLVRLSKEMGGRPQVVATGGLSTLIGPHVKAIARILPTLTLDGLRAIWHINQKG